MCPEMYGWLVLSVAVLGNDGAFVGGIPQGWLDHRAVSSEGINASIEEWAGHLESGLL